MRVGLYEQLLRVIGAGLFEEHFEEDVGVEEELIQLRYADT